MESQGVLKSYLLWTLEKPSSMDSQGAREERLSTMDAEKTSSRDNHQPKPVPFSDSSCSDIVIPHKAQNQESLEESPQAGGRLGFTTYVLLPGTTLLLQTLVLEEVARF